VFKWRSAGAGLPRLIFAASGLLAWLRMKIARKRPPKFLWTSHRAAILSRPSQLISSSSQSRQSHSRRRPF
jgi:hypothetical protein